MENKYLNEAIIGNKKMLATFTQKGEMQRMYFPSKDNKQYINFFHTGVKVNESDLIYLHDDINNIYKQYYDTDTNILNTEITNTYFNLKILQFVLEVIVMAESKLTIKKRNPLKGEDGSKVISVRIKDETIHRLDELAKETNRSRNEIIGILLEFGLDNVEVE